MDTKNFISAVTQIAEEKGIPAPKIFEVIEKAYAAAYKKDFGKKGQIIRAKLDVKNNKVQFWQIKLVVDESMIYSAEELEELKLKGLAERETREDPEEITEGERKKVRFSTERHIMVEEAPKTDPKVKPGDELAIELETREDYGRIAAQTAKQVILQRLREAEREIVLAEYKDKEGEIVSGIVQRLENRNVFVDIGKTLGILPREEQTPGEFYRPGQRLKFFVLKVEDSPRGAIIFLSRAYPRFISKLFELEVPEIAQEAVVIRSIAREAGSRSKVAVESKAEGVDPIGSVVGQRGIRVSAVISELGGEKIDIIEYSDDPEKFLANSLSPAKVIEIKIMPKNKALAIVPEEQLSLAIGKEGQNVRLAAKLTGWKIDVRGPSSIKEGEDETETKEEKLEKIKKPRKEVKKSVKKVKK